MIESKVKLKNDILNYALEAGNPYLLGAFAPIFDEIVAKDLEVEGDIPKDITGIYFRNGPNPKYVPLNHYHLFDGDGMLHSVQIENGKATYRNRWIRTEGFVKESKAAKGLYQGTMGQMNDNPEEGHRLKLKDTANTAISFHNNKLYAGWYMCADLYAIDPFTLETIGTEDFNDTMNGNQVMAHVKVDEVTNEMMYFDYGPQPPYLTYGVVNGKVKHHVEIELPGPRLPHDMAITENYSILMDLPLMHNKGAIEAGRASISFHQDMPSRFAVLPRYGDNSSVIWFEAKPCYIYHVVNAWEEGDEVIMDCCITPDPTPQRNFSSAMEKLNAYLRLEAHLYRYHFNLKTGETKEYQLDDLPTEFPMMRSSMIGRKTRYAYNQKFDNSEKMRFDALVKYDTENQTSQIHYYGNGKFGSEAPFVPRENSQFEDDGYVITFITDERTERSEVFIYNAQQVDKGPLCKNKLPQRVPLGFHGCWVNGDRLFN